MPSVLLKLTAVLLLTISLAGVSSAEDHDRKVTAADMPRLPHVDANQAVETFRTAAGFEVELVAAEPLVSDPVDACFDEFGRMFVAEMHGYPFSHEPTKLNPSGGGKQGAGIIRLLEDTDGDGRMDRSHVFADELDWPTSVTCYNGGIFVLAPEFLYYLKDTDGDGTADRRDVVLEGFGRGNVQAVTNGLQWGLDNRICFASGRNRKQLIHRGVALPALGAGDLSFNPRKEDFTAATGGLQFGHTQDDWGVRFVCSNSNHIMQVVYAQNFLSRNPFHVASQLVRSIAADGASAPVYRISPPEPWRIVRQKWRALDKGYRLEINDDGGWEFIPVDSTKQAGVIPTEYPTGYFTSATGITIYRGDAYPEEFRGNAFVGDVGGNLVHRKTLSSREIVYTAHRADVSTEILASTDNWFRPVNFVNAPDGSLYVLDMYRETIEHPHSIPAEIKKFLDLSSGDNRGRIYRLVSPNMRRRKVVQIGELRGGLLVQQLASENGWNRDTAQRLIWERGERSMVPLLQTFLRTSTSAKGRLHALWSLKGLNSLTSGDLHIGLTDRHPRVRAAAVLLAGDTLDAPPELLRLVVKLANDPSSHVRFQVAFSLGESASTSAIEALTNMCLDKRNGPEIQTAVYSSCRDSAGEIAARLMRLWPAAAADVIAHLAIIAGSNDDPAVAQPLLKAVITVDSLSVQSIAVNGLGEGLRRRGSSVQKFVASLSVSAEIRGALATLFGEAATLAGDETADETGRVSAIDLLQFADSELALPTLSSLLNSRSSRKIQKATVESLGSFPGAAASQLLLAEWRALTPELRNDVVDRLLSTQAGVVELLNQVERGLVSSQDLRRTHKQALLNHRDETIRGRSETIFSEDQTSKRSAVVKAFRDTLALDGDAARGRKIFRKHCSLCHRVGDVGHNVAPDLASVKNKSDADLLIAILDPNRESLPAFQTYTVVTHQGRSYNGIIADESTSSLTLRRAEAKTDVILRSNIEEMVASGVSLMPEGLEKDLSQQQLADVIAFVKSIGGTVQR